jgi:hypothetical protein
LWQILPPGLLPLFYSQKLITIGLEVAFNVYRAGWNDQQLRWAFTLDADESIDI